MSLLRDEYTFGLNRIYLMFEELGFKTSFHVVVNPLVIEQCRTEIARIDVPQFLSWAARPYLPSGSRPILLQNVNGPRFSRDVTKPGIWEGATVTYVALQLAFHLGFRHVILVGVDHNFVTKGPANKTIVSTGDDANHFDSRYFGRGFRWQLPDLATSEIAYRLARRAFEEAGGSVIDATVDGQCQVFEKRALERAL